MTDKETNTQATGGDVAKETDAKTTEKKDAKAPASLKWYKVKSGCINGVLHSAKFPFVQLTEDTVKAYGKEYVDPKGYATEKDCPLKEEDEE